MSVQTDADLQAKVGCRASFYTDGTTGTLFLDPALDGYASVLIVYHEFIHALDEDYRAARYWEKHRRYATKNPLTELNAEKKAYQAVYQLIQELKECDPSFCQFLRQKKAEGVDLDRVFSDDEIKRAHGFSKKGAA